MSILPGVVLLHIIFLKKGPMKNSLKLRITLLEPLTLVCLGPLTNLAEAIRSDSGIVRKIDRVIWYNEATKPMRGFNFECDKKAADEVMNARLKIIMISNLQ